MKVNFYQTKSGRSPIEDFISDLEKADKARFAEVIIGIEEFGLGYSEYKSNRSEASFGKLNFHPLGEAIEWLMF